MSILNYIFIGLLSVNLIVLLIVVLKKKPQQDTGTQMILDQKILENQRDMMNEMNELKIELSKQQKILLKKMEELRVEKQVTYAAPKPVEPVKKEPSLFLNDRYKDIFALHQQGMTIDEIAKKLEKGVGEVSLILQLANQDDA
ncbi:DUF6115 domain-containing protein [Bacillus sp. JJ1764]|uniref:DUF6115 domain-containing protein n=1 Tax=Bacillus sp. JJ1764 TaxID=3122964 RepID=UPI002FFDBC22